MIAEALRSIKRVLSLSEISSVIARSVATKQSIAQQAEEWIASLRSQ
jgi:hypothetical protein